MLEERAQEAQDLAREHMQDMVKKQEEKAESEAARRIEVCKRVVARMLRQQLETAWSTFSCTPFSFESQTQNWQTEPVSENRATTNPRRVLKTVRTPR